MPKYFATLSQLIITLDVICNQIECEVQIHVGTLRHRTFSVDKWSDNSKPFV